MAKPKVEQPRQYKVKKGYAWIGPDGNPSGAEIVTENDPGFNGQRHKLEPITAETEKRDGKQEAPKPKKRVGKSSENRMGGSKETRGEEEIEEEIEEE